MNYLQEDLESILETILEDHGLEDPNILVDKYDFVPGQATPQKDPDGVDCFCVAVWVNSPEGPDHERRVSLVFPAPTVEQAQDPGFIKALMEGAAMSLKWMAELPKLGDADQGMEE